MAVSYCPSDPAAEGALPTLRTQDRAKLITYGGEEVRHLFPFPPQLTSASCCLLASLDEAPCIHLCAMELVSFFFN